MDPEKALEEYLKKGMDNKGKKKAIANEDVTVNYTKMKKEVNYESDSDDFGRGDT